MKKIILGLIVTGSTSLASFAGDFSYQCTKNINAGGMPGVTLATLVGPTRDFDYRIRIFSKNGSQIETGQ